MEHPAYSLNLSACDFHTFGPLKQALKRSQFQSDTQVKQPVHDFSQQQPSKYFEKSIQQLVLQWDACLNVGSDIV
jgi:hypothetical protein